MNLFDIIDDVTEVWKRNRDIPRDLCPLCGEDRAHASQHGDHAQGARSGCHSYPNGMVRENELVGLDPTGAHVVPMAGVLR